MIRYVSRSAVSGAAMHELPDELGRASIIQRKCSGTHSGSIPRADCGGPFPTVRVQRPRGKSRRRGRDAKSGDHVIMHLKRAE